MEWPAHLLLVRGGGVSIATNLINLFYKEMKKNPNVKII